MIAAQKTIKASAFLLACSLAASSSWAADRVRLTTPVSGVVKEVYVQVGQRVKKGDKLLALDDTRLRARVMEAEAGMMRVQHEAEEADREFKRAEELYERGVSSTTEFDAAKLRHARATANAREAEAQLIIARKNLDDTVLKAPFDGIVRAREAEPGMYVPAQLNPPTLIILGKIR
jgi:RND family efflux transporter MFP subunit